MLRVIYSVIKFNKLQFKRKCVSYKYVQYLLFKKVPLTVEFIYIPRKIVRQNYINIYSTFFFFLQNGGLQTWLQMCHKLYTQSFFTGNKIFHPENCATRVRMSHIYTPPPPPFFFTKLHVENFVTEFYAP